MLKRFWKWLWGEAEPSPHECEEWTQWTRRTQSFNRLPTTSDVKAVQEKGELIHYTLSWQERRCTVCGFIEQDRLEHAMEDVECGDSE